MLKTTMWRAWGCIGSAQRRPSPAFLWVRHLNQRPLTMALLRADSPSVNDFYARSFDHSGFVPQHKGVVTKRYCNE